jgi:hypothetical protein
MGKSKAGRKLDPYRVALAERTARMKHELAMKMVAERVKVDAEFAADVLKIAGETLREEIKQDAKDTILRAMNSVNVPIVGGDTTDQLVPEQTDGGGVILVRPTELPTAVKDGQ